jgi:hypothetical protein
MFIARINEALSILMRIEIEGITLLEIGLMLRTNFTEILSTISLECAH